MSQITIVTKVHNMAPIKLVLLIWDYLM